MAQHLRVRDSFKFPSGAAVEQLIARPRQKACAPKPDVATPEAASARELRPREFERGTGSPSLRVDLACCHCL